MKNSTYTLINKKLRELSSRNIRYKYADKQKVTCSIKRNGKTVKISYYVYQFDILLSMLHHCDKHISDWFNYCNKLAEQIKNTRLLYSVHIMFKSNREGYLSEFSVGRCIYEPQFNTGKVYSPWDDAGLNDVCQCLLLSSDCIINSSYFNNLEFSDSAHFYIPLKTYYSTNFEYINAFNVNAKLYTVMKRDPIVDIILEKNVLLTELIDITQETNIKRFIVEFNKAFESYPVHLSIEDNKFHMEFTDNAYKKNTELGNVDQLDGMDVLAFYSRDTISSNVRIPVALIIYIYVTLTCYTLSKKLSTESINVIVQSISERYTINDIFIDDNDKLTLVIGTLELSDCTPVPINIADIADNNILDLAKYMCNGIDDCCTETTSFYHKSNLYTVIMFSPYYAYDEALARSPIGVSINGKKSKVTKQIVELCSVLDL